MAFMYLTHLSTCHFEPTRLRGRLKRGMTTVVWPGIPACALLPSEGHFCTGKSACATQFSRRQRIGHWEMTDIGGSGETSTLMPILNTKY